MPYLLNVVYLLVLLAASPWLVYQAIRKGKYREGFAAKLLGRAPRRGSEKTCLWLHAVSVGEVNLLATLLKEIAAQKPDWECVVSTTMTLALAKISSVVGSTTPGFSWAVHRPCGSPGRARVSWSGVVAQPDSGGRSGR